MMWWMFVLLVLHLWSEGAVDIVVQTWPEADPVAEITFTVLTADEHIRVYQTDAAGRVTLSGPPGSTVRVLSAEYQGTDLSLVHNHPDGGMQMTLTAAPQSVVLSLSDTALFVVPHDELTGPLPFPVEESGTAEMESFPSPRPSSTIPPVHQEAPPWRAVGVLCGILLGLLGVVVVLLQQRRARQIAHRRKRI